MGRGNIFFGGFCAGQGLGSVPIDQIADELNMLGIVTGSTDDLLELLKTKERPRRGDEALVALAGRRYYRSGDRQTETQAGKRNSGQ